MTHVDMSDLKRFAAKLKVEAPELVKDFQQGLAAAGEIVAAKARSNASFSSRIPASIKVRRRGSRVKIQAGSSLAPHAAPLENHGRPGTFRHPVFGDREVWVSQPARPFLTPAAEDSVEAVEAAVLSLVDVTVARIVS